MIHVRLFNTLWTFESEPLINRLGGHHVHGAEHVAHDFRRWVLDDYNMESTAFKFYAKRPSRHHLHSRERRKEHSYKIIRNRNYFSIVAKFHTKNAASMPLKNNASVRQQDKKQLSSEDNQIKKPKT